MTRCLIEGISHDGHGVGRLDGMVVFIPGALPGESVDIEVIQRKKNFARGRLNFIAEASPQRVAPPCPYYWQCGGCSYQHSSYRLQLELKTQVVKQTLQRLGKIDVPVNPCLGSHEIWGYRNKVTWHGVPGEHDWKLGYYRSDAHDILPVDNCLLISSPMQQISNALNNSLQKYLYPLSMVELTVRESSFDNGLMAIISGPTLEQVRTLNDTNNQDICIIHYENQCCTVLRGEPFLREKLGDILFDISPMAFFQVNKGQAERMLQIIRDWLNLKGNEQVLDIYCGVGSLALNLAPRVRAVTGIEAFGLAVKDAKKNARANAIKNARFLSGRTETVLPTLNERFDAIILDPPRSGCGPGVVQAVARLRIPQAIYISCEPSALARDLAHFTQAGYTINEVQPLDMFPWTRHVECVTLMSRVEK